MMKMTFMAAGMAVAALAWGRTCDVTDYGARPDGNTDNTAAIQKAIDDCSAKGGGRVLVPGGGVYKTYTLKLRNDVELHIARGATLKGETFQIAPQSAKINVEGTDVLKCVAAGAQSYEWYEDGERIPDETSDSLTVMWTHRKPHIRTYKVVPVYIVGVDTIRGTAATATVEMTPLGVKIVGR